MTREIFVFGSNLAGRHGKGAALEARFNHGAHYGQGIGLQGDSYAIPTKDEKMRVMPLLEIQKHVDIFIRFAWEHLDWTFVLTNIGCGLAGYKPEEIAPLFSHAPNNVHMTPEFEKVLGRKSDDNSWNRP